jgi:hypothetical protein
VNSYSESASSLSKAGSLPQQASLPSPALGSLPQTQSYVYKHAGLTVSQSAARRTRHDHFRTAHHVTAREHLSCDLAHSEQQSNRWCHVRASADDNVLPVDLPSCRSKLGWKRLLLTCFG